MSNKLTVNEKELTFKTLSFIENMGVKRIIEPLILSMYSASEDGSEPDRSLVRERFYSQSESTFNDIIKILLTTISKIDKKTKLKESDIDKLLSSIDIEDILYILNRMYAGNIGDDDKKK